MQLKHLRRMRNLDNNDKQTDERYQKFFMNDKECDERYQISTFDEEKRLKI